MTRTSLTDINNRKYNPLKPKFSFGSLLEKHFDMFDQVFDEFHGHTSKLSLPYNTILIDDTTYRIEIALAGYKRDEIEIYTENNYLYVDVSIDQSKKAESAEETDASDIDNLSIKSYPHYLHKGISRKYTQLRFGIPKQANIYNAKLEDGILTVDITVDKPKPNRQSISIG